MSPGFVLYQILIGMNVFQKFSKCNIGQHLNHTDRTGRVKLLTCTEKIKGVPQWKFADGKCSFDGSKTIVIIK